MVAEALDVELIQRLAGRDEEEPIRGVDGAGQHHARAEFRKENLLLAAEEDRAGQGTEEGPDGLRVEGGAAVLAEEIGSSLALEGVGGVSDGHGEQAREPGDLVPGKAVGIARAVEVFAVPADGAAHGFEGVDEAGEFLAEHRVLADDGALLFGQGLRVTLPLLDEDAGGADQADVVEAGTEIEDLTLFRG